MVYEINARKENHIDQNTKQITFEDFVILYLNYKPQFKIEFNEICDAFNRMAINAKGKNEIFTREKFVQIMQNTGRIFVLLLGIHFFYNDYFVLSHNLGDQISPQEMEILLHTLSKTTNNISSDTCENIYSIHPATTSFTASSLVNTFLLIFFIAFV